MSKLILVVDPKRSALMSRVRRTGTTPELLLRKALFAEGLRYVLKRREKLPGSPDIIFVAAKVAVFVDGCFWHGCPQHATMPKNNAAFWQAKIETNRRRDVRVDAELRELDWTVIRVWEHQIRENLPSITKAIVASIALAKQAD